MPNEDFNEAKERVLDAAESLFMERGYSSVKLKDIAGKLGFKESSLYYHFPKGKEELYVTVMRRNFQKHQQGVVEAIKAAGGDWVAQLRHVGYWIIDNHGIDVMRLHKSDLPAIDRTSAYELTEMAYEALNVPIRSIFTDAEARGEAVTADYELLSGIFVSMISGIEVIDPAWNPKTKYEMVDAVVEMCVNGLRQR